MSDVEKGHLHAVRDEESGGMEAALGLDGGSCMPGLGSVAPGGAGGWRWSWWHHPPCLGDAHGFFADELFCAAGTRHLVATADSRAGHTQWVSVSVPGTCPVSLRAVYGTAHCAQCARTAPTQGFQPSRRTNEPITHATSLVRRTEEGSHLLKSEHGDP